MFTTADLYHPIEMYLQAKRQRKWLAIGTNQKARFIKNRLTNSAPLKTLENGNSENIERMKN